MPAVKLTTHRVEKPWGRRDLAPLFEDQPADRPPIGEERTVEFDTSEAARPPR